MKKVIISLVGIMAISGPVAAQDHDENVLATRGKAVLSHEEFDARMAEIPEKDRSVFLFDGKRLEQALWNLLLREQLAIEAMEAGFDQDPAVMARMRLAQQEALARIWLDHYIRSQPEPDYAELAREQHMLNPQEYMSDPSWDVSHLLISQQIHSKDEAKEIAEDVLEQVRANPESFDELILKYTEDESAVNNKGKFKNVKRGDMVSGFERAMLNMEEGEISNLVYTPFGYHIIRMDKVNKVRTLSYDEVRARLVEEQRAKHLTRLRNDYLSQFMNQKTQMREEDLKEMLSRYFTEEELGEWSQSD